MIHCGAGGYLLIYIYIWYHQTLKSIYCLSDLVKQLFRLLIYSWFEILNHNWTKTVTIRMLVFHPANCVAQPTETNHPTATSQPRSLTMFDAIGPRETSVTTQNSFPALTRSSSRCRHRWRWHSERCQNQVMSIRFIENEARSYFEGMSWS